MPAPARNRGHRLAAYRQCSTDLLGCARGQTGEGTMPLVKIETRKWMSVETKRALLDAVHTSLVVAFRIPEHDRNQRISEYAPEDFEASPGRGQHFTVVTIDAFAGRSLEAKRRLYKELASRLEPLGVPPNDLVVVVHDIPLESWGTRGGKAACDVDLGFEVKV